MVSRSFQIAEYLIDCTGSPAGLPARLSVFGPPTAPRLRPDLGNLRRAPCVTVAVALVCGRRETKAYTQLTYLVYICLHIATTCQRMFKVELVAQCVIMRY